MKKDMVLLDRACKEGGLDVWKVLDMHDEGQYDVLPNEVEIFTELCKTSMVKAGESFNLNCPMQADVKIGKNWAFTH